ncbi:hypothetical protein [Zunongwangia endophytica]|uniref:Uncharacterized protein n=1 Tax=Zunongwangia endophytica TaxID=1808945 RepID=A0ABV8H5S8_9FLAO|nr:hypothetical protein [Zunongwangia endophytica]MDN3593481.1 hypothetical protein [Zunongwangia endophytica]
MNLLETYFYIIIVLYQLFSLFIVTTSEDLKENKYFNKYFKITIIIGPLGLIFELFNWIYLCKYNCILLTFSPLITLLTSKGIISFCEKIINKEGFAVGIRGVLLDGIWVKNKCSSKSVFDQLYNAIYSLSLSIIPYLIIEGTFDLIEKNVC